MSQTIADREVLIARLERDALAHPKVYRWKVTALAVLGFFYIGLTMSLTTLGLLAIGLALWAVPSVLTQARPAQVEERDAEHERHLEHALRVPFPPPVGDRLEPAAHPKLFARIEKIRAELDGPTVHEVLLFPELNAAIVGVPRLGLFGWDKNYMLLGLDLLAIMADDEFDSVIAHEMGHLSGKHGKVSAWIYRVRRTWFQIAENAATDGGPSFAFRRFFNWFIPYFSAYSFVSRACTSTRPTPAKVTSPEVAGRALCRVEAAATHLGEVFWPQIHERAKSSTEPPRDLYHALRTVTRGVEAELVTGYVSDALSRRPTVDDTHPSLAQRLAALGVEPARLQPPARLAGDAYLGAQFESKLQLFSEKWADEVAESWSDAHSMLESGNTRLEQLREQRAAAELSTDEEHEYACLIATLEGDDAARPLFEALVARAPDNVDALMNLGMLRLAAGDRAGIEPLERAMDLHKFVTIPACNAIIEYFFNHGAPSDAQPWVDRADVFEEELAAAQHERMNVFDADLVIPPTVDAEVLDALADTLAEWKGECATYFVEKVANHFPEMPIYLLAVEKRLGPVQRSASGCIDKLVELPLPLESLWVDLGEGSVPKLARRIRKLDGCRII